MRKGVDESVGLGANSSESLHICYTAGGIEPEIKSQQHDPSLFPKSWIFVVVVEGFSLNNARLMPN